MLILLNCGISASGAVYAGLIRNWHSIFPKYKYIKINPRLLKTGVFLYSIIMLLTQKLNSLSLQYLLRSLVVLGSYGNVGFVGAGTHKGVAVLDVYVCFL